MCLPTWAVMGDFNLICRVDDKSNSNINLRMLRRFRGAINDLELKDLPLLGRRFTWSNEQAQPTMTKIDKVLVSKDWEAKFPDYQLRAGSSEISDHCPLFLKKFTSRKFSGFRFESWWAGHADFISVVSAAWNKHVLSHNHIRRLHIKLIRTAKALKRWSREVTWQRRLQAAVASEVIFQLDVAQENRFLSPDEITLRALLKSRLLAFAAIDRMRWRQ